MKPILLKLPPALLAEIDKRAAATFEPRAAIIRELLRLALTVSKAARLSREGIKCWNLS